MLRLRFRLYTRSTRPPARSGYGDRCRSIERIRRSLNTRSHFAQFDEGRAELGGEELEKVSYIKDLVEFHRMPLVVEFNDETAPRIFRRSARTHVLMFISKAASYFEQKLAEFREVALLFRGKVWSLYCTVDPGHYGLLSHGHLYDISAVYRHPWLSAPGMLATLYTCIYCR